MKKVKYGNTNTYSINGLQNYLDAYENNLALEKDWKAIMAYDPKVIHFGHANDQTTQYT